MTGRAPLPPRQGWLQRSMAAVMLFFVLGCEMMAHADSPEVTADKAEKEGSVWGGLIYASDFPPLERHPPSQEFPDLTRRLARVFPYRFFDVLGEHTQVIFRQYESWIVPSKNLFLKLDAKGTAPHGGILVNLQFWQGQEVLVKMDAILRPNSPLFVAGPKWRRGRLIFVVELRKMDAVRH